MKHVHHPATLSHRLQLQACHVAAIAEAALSIPGNDNAGLAWRIDDDAALTFDDRLHVEVSVTSPHGADYAAIITAHTSDWWRAQWTPSLRSVGILSTAPASRSQRRRVNTLRHFLTAAGLRARLV